MSSNKYIRPNFEPYESMKKKQKKLKMQFPNFFCEKSSAKTREHKIANVKNFSSIGYI